MAMFNSYVKLPEGISMVKWSLTPKNNKKTGDQLCDVIWNSYMTAAMMMNIGVPFPEDMDEFPSIATTLATTKYVQQNPKICVGLSKPNLTEAQDSSIIES